MTLPSRLQGSLGLQSVLVSCESGKGDLFINDFYAPRITGGRPDSCRAAQAATRAPAAARSRGPARWASAPARSPYSSNAPPQRGPAGGVSVVADPDPIGPQCRGGINKDAKVIVGSPRRANGSSTAFLPQPRKAGGHGSSGWQLVVWVCAAEGFCSEGTTCSGQLAEVYDGATRWALASTSWAAERATASCGASCCGQQQHEGGSRGCGGRRGGGCERFLQGPQHLHVLRCEYMICEWPGARRHSGEVTR